MASHKEVTVPHTIIGEHIIDILKKGNYVDSYGVKEVEGRKYIEVVLSKVAKVHHYKRISKPGRRIYTKAGQIPLVLRGLGMVILSTPKGIMSGKEAHKLRVGGEILCEVY